MDAAQHRPGGCRCGAVYGSAGCAGYMMTDDDCTNCAYLEAQIELLQTKIERLRRTIEILKRRLEKIREFAEKVLQRTELILSQPHGVKRGNWAYAKGADKIARIVRKLPQSKGVR